MTFVELEQYFRAPTITDLALAVGVSRQTIHAWKRNGEIPFLQQLRLENLTKGRLKADEVSPQA